MTQVMSGKCRVLDWGRDVAIRPINILSLCSGIGGLDLGVHRALKSLGFAPRVVCYVEGEAYAASILVKQMEKGNLDQAPVWSDLKTFDCEPWRGKVDLVIGGYPCQPFSAAGKRLGDKDPRHLWPYVLRVLAGTRAPLLFCENVRGHVSKGLGEVLGQVSCFGFDAEWDVFSAEEEGAPHRRERLFVFAYADRERFNRDSMPSRPSKEFSLPSRCGRWETEPAVGRVASGVPNRVDRIRALGNAVVPQCAERAFYELWERALNQQ